MKILVTFALETEVRAVAELARISCGQPLGDVAVYRAQIGAAEVDVILTGVGRNRRAETAKVLGGDPHSIHLCVCSGLAGALKPEYRIGRDVWPRDRCVR